MNDSIWNKNFLFLIFSNLLTYITYYAILSGLPIYLVNEMHTSKVQVGLIVGIYTVASVMVRPFSGFTIDRFGRRSIFLLALVFYSLLLPGYLIALSITSIIILRFAQGLVWGFTTVSASIIAVDITPPQKRGEGIGYYAVSTTLGMSIGPVVGLFVCHQWGYTVFFVSTSVLSLVGLACGYAVSLRKRYVVGKHIHLEWNNLFDKSSMRLSFNVFLAMISYGGLLSFIALFGREIGIHNSSLYFLFYSISVASSRIFLGKVFDRQGPGKLMTWCMTLLILGFPVLALAKDAWMFYTSALIIGFGTGMIVPTFQSMINNIADANHRGAANSTLYTAIDLGMSVGMIIAGVIAQHISLAAIFWASTFVCAATLLVFRYSVLAYYENFKKSI